LAALRSSSANLRLRKSGVVISPAERTFSSVASRPGLRRGQADYPLLITAIRREIVEHGSRHGAGCTGGDSCRTSRCQPLAEGAIRGRPFPRPDLKRPAKEASSNAGNMSLAAETGRPRSYPPMAHNVDNPRSGWPSENFFLFGPQPPKRSRRSTALAHPMPWLETNPIAREPSPDAASAATSAKVTSDPLPSAAGQPLQAVIPSGDGRHRRINRRASNTCG